jgi:hypothetical protein
MCRRVTQQPNDVYATAIEYLPIKSTTPPVCQNLNVTSVTDYRQGLMQTFSQRSQNNTRLAWRIAVTIIYVRDGVISEHEARLSNICLNPKADIS